MEEGSSRSRRGRSPSLYRDFFSASVNTRSADSVGARPSKGGSVELARERSASYYWMGLLFWWSNLLVDVNVEVSEAGVISF